MGFPIAKLAGRAALVGTMIAGGLLAAGIAQAQAQTLPPGVAPALTPAAPFAPRVDAQPTPADRQAELIAAVGGPAPAQHLIVATPERPSVEIRADDVQDATPDPADALNAAEAARGASSAQPAAPQAR